MGAQRLIDVMNDRYVLRVIEAARFEQARTVEDVLSRRTRALLLNAKGSQDMAARVADILAEELGHDAAWKEQQVKVYRELAQGYTLS